MTTGCFTLSGSFDPDDITSTLGIRPTWVACIGDLEPRGSATPRVAAVWCLSAKEESSGDVADQLIEILTPLRDVSTLVAELSVRCNGKIHLISFRDGSQESWFLSKDIFSDVASLRVPVECWIETIAQHEAHKERLRADQISD